MMDAGKFISSFNLGRALVSWFSNLSITLGTKNNARQIFFGKHQNTIISVRNILGHFDSWLWCNLQDALNLMWGRIRSFYQSGFFCRYRCYSKCESSCKLCFRSQISMQRGLDTLLKQGFFLGYLERYILLRSLI